MKTKASFLFNLITLCSLVLATWPAGVQAGAPTPEIGGGQQVQVAQSLPASTPAVSYDEALDKLSPDLQELVLSAGTSPEGMRLATPGEQEAIFVQVIARAGAEQGLDLSPYFVGGQFYAQPVLDASGLQVSFGLIEPASVLKLAFLAQVEAISSTAEARNEFDLYPADDPRPEVEYGPEDWAVLRANADKLREGSLPWSQAPAFGDGRPYNRPADWFEMAPQGPVQAPAAWARGYTGQGVAVSVIDDGVDLAHPDLMGTHLIYSSTLQSQYNGWPMVMDPFAMRAYFYELLGDTPRIANGHPGVTYIDTSATPALSPCGIGLSCFRFTPLIAYGTPGLGHTYIISSAMSQSGVVHVGTHVDESLRDYVWGERVAVLVADPDYAGAYNTVYVDLDDDYDFRDEKPVTRADTTNAATLEATYNNPVSYRDMNGDGLADLNGGLLYFIADGVYHVPAFEWMFLPGAYGIEPPGDGDLIAMHGPWSSGYSHGTHCASNVVGQGMVNANLPTFRDAAPTAAVYGPAPAAKLVPMNYDYGFADRITAIDAYHLAAGGYDGIWQNDSRDTDAIQATSNSYGWSAEDNDGWERVGQVVDALQRGPAPSMQFFFSVGNGGTGYGTVAPPSPSLGIAVGASTQFGATGWDSITDTNQIMFNDVASLSNAGPSALKGVGVDVLAGGAYAAGADELNFSSRQADGTFDGNQSWVDWGGTSRSAPVAMGVAALVYQAYKEAHGIWPTSQEVKAILMSGATDVNINVLKQGAGAVNADRATAIAGGHYGLSMAAGSATWEPGGYRGVETYTDFAHVAYPGDTFTKTFALQNHGTQTVTADVQAVEFKLIRAEEFDYTVSADMVAAESVNGAENRDNFYKGFNYFIPITATAGLTGTVMYGVKVPQDTQLMVVRQVFPFEEFDSDGDYGWDNRFYLVVYNWKDVNGDGNVWEDKDGNGVVNFINGDEFPYNNVDEPELAWDDPRNELDRWEYGRFGYHRPSGNANEVMVHDPLARMHDGLFIGLRHHPGSTYAGDTHLRYRIEFYKKQAVDWLDVGELRGTAVLPDRLPPGAEATFVATATVPLDMPAGDYEAAIEISSPAWDEYDANTIVVPVGLNVAAVLTDGLQLGGHAAYEYDQDRLYNNGAMRGYFDWDWREESADWRFFYTDVPDGAYPEGTQLLVKDEWEAPAPHTDVDTVILGPTPSRMTEVEFGAWAYVFGPWSYYNPDFYGPYTLETVGHSPNVRSGRSVWNFDTSTGANEDWIAAPLQDGLHEILQHNVLFEGNKFDVVFTKTLGTAQVLPDDLYLETFVNQGQVGQVSFESSLPLNGLVAQAYGLGGPEYILNEPLDFINSNTFEWTRAFSVENALKIELWTSSPDIADIDLALFYWNGVAWEQRGASATGSADEHILYMNPEDGQWMAAVNNWSGPAGHFDLTTLVVQGSDLSISGLPTGTIAANTSVTFTVNFERDMVPGETYEGLLVVGPPEAPNLKEIPIVIWRALAVEKQVNSAIAYPGDELDYTITFYNNASQPTAFELVDAIPAGTVFVDATTDVPGTGSLYDTENERIYFNGTVDPGAWTISLTVQVASTATLGSWITNTVTLQELGTLLFDDVQSASASTHVAIADLGDSYKTATAEIDPLGSINYEVHVINNGDGMVHVNVRDPIPAHMTFANLDDSPPYQHFTYNAALNQVEWSGYVAAGEEWVFGFSVTADSAATWTTVTNTAYIEDDQGMTLVTPLLASTDVRPYSLYLPLITKSQ
jgi:uncharacterized repeat protein (TIGR01451 family)